MIERLKIAALAQGLRISAPLLDGLGGPTALTVHEYSTTGGITLELPLGVLVNAPFDEPFNASSPLLLTAGDGGLELRLGAEVMAVERVLPLPGYLDVVDAAGDRVADTTMSHADRIRVSPIAGCVYDCRFCDLAGLRYAPRDVRQVLRGIDVALADDALHTRHLLISGGSPARGQVHQDAFEATCLEIVDHVKRRTADRPDPFEVDIMMSPSATGPGFVERLVAAGAGGFSLNLEIYSDEHAAAKLPLKRRFAREHLAPTISRAVELLGAGSGRVRSLVIPGLEPVDSTLAGIEWLASLGCSPVLSPFRPARGTALHAAPPPEPSQLREILTETRVIVARHGVILGPRCVPCQHNTLSFPWDLDALAATARTG